jgi:nucleoside-diphosphate-sugar epimerase
MRPPFVYGAENPFYREAFFWDRLRLNRPIIIPGDGNRLMQFVYVNDLVEACISALEKHTAPGRAFNVADEKPLTQIEVVTEFAKAIGKQATIARVPRELIVRNGGNPMGDPMYFGQYYDLPPITEAVGRVKRVLNLALTPFATGLKETHKWYQRQAAPAKKPSFKFEENLIKLARERILT